MTIPTIRRSTTTTQSVWSLRGGGEARRVGVFSCGGASRGLQLQQTGGEEKRKEKAGRSERLSQFEGRGQLDDGLAATDRNVEHFQPVADPCRRRWSSWFHPAEVVFSAPRLGRARTCVRVAEIPGFLLVCLLLKRSRCHGGSSPLWPPRPPFLPLWLSLSFLPPPLLHHVSVRLLLCHTVPASATFRLPQQAASWMFWGFFSRRIINADLKSSGIQRDSESVCHLEADFTAWCCDVRQWSR